MSEKATHTADEKAFRKLQELLFVDDGELTDSIRQEIESLRDEIRGQKEVEERVMPLIDGKVEYMQENFAELFGPAMAATIKKQIVESQDEMIDALYPIIGRLIRKFLAKELERIVARMDASINEAFSIKSWRRRMVNWFKGESRKDSLVREMARPEFEDVYIIDKESGLLAGSWSRQHTTDQDMVAGMLTAIKSFVESAFQSGDQDLETIEYDTYKILIHNFHTFYIAVIVSGVVSPQFKTMLYDYVMAFEERNRIQTRTEITGEVLETNSHKLKAYFDEFKAENQ